jgi:polyisoprenyl-teichoic acid--peptidoglycan teichoic acid transferase
MMPQSRRKIPTGQTRRRRAPKAYEVLPVLVLALLFCILGYILIAGLFLGGGSNPAYAYAMQTKQALESAPTPTPFQPEDGTTVTGERSQGESPGEGPIETPRVLHKPEGQVNILLLGSDIRPNEGGFRTDVIVWVSLNPKSEFVSAVSFPRDLYVRIPGQGENRINVAFPRGGFDLLAETFEVNFGIRPDHYILVDFNGFTTVINNLGGINVQTAQNLSDSCATWVDPSGWCSVGPGTVHMNGDLALWYARSRYSTNDIDRSRRAQEVIEAIFHRLMSLDILLRVPELYNAYTTYVQTDLTLGDVLNQMPLASKIQENGDIRNYVLGYDHAYDWVTVQGAQVLVPDYAAIQDLLVEALELEY